MADQHRHSFNRQQSQFASVSSASELPREALIARTEVLWEVLALQLKPSEAEVNSLVASLPAAPSTGAATFAASSLDASLQWTQPSPADASAIVLQTLRDLGVISTLQLDIRELAKLILSIRKLYRLPDECAYHNWSHASAVAHYACILAYRLELTRRFASPLPVFALIIAALCHDMDHRGTTNVFNVNQRTTIWHAYAYSCTHLKSNNETSNNHNSSGNGPLLEVHHLTLCQGLFKNCYPHLLDRFSPNDVTQFFRLVEAIILATDLVAHPRVVQSVKQLRPADLTSSAPFPLIPIVSLFIGACDLNAAARDWVSALKAARGIYHERAKEESLSSTSFPPIHNIGQDQCLFVERFVRPIFVEIVRLFPTAHPSLTAVDVNLNRWRKLTDEHSRSSFSFADLSSLIERAEEDSRQNDLKSPTHSTSTSKSTVDYTAAATRKTSPRQRRAAAAVASNKRPKQSVR